MGIDTLQERFNAGNRPRTADVYWPPEGNYQRPDWETGPGRHVESNPDASLVAARKKPPAPIRIGAANYPIRMFADAVLVATVEHLESVAAPLTDPFHSPVFSFGSLPAEVFIEDDAVSVSMVAVFPELFTPELATALQQSVLARKEFRRFSIRWNPAEAGAGNMVVLRSDRASVCSFDGRHIDSAGIEEWQAQQMERWNARFAPAWRRFHRLKQAVRRADWSTNLNRVAASFETETEGIAMVDVWYAMPSRGNEIWNPCDEAGTDLVDDSGEALDYYPLSAEGLIGLRGEQYFDQKLILQGHRYARDAIPDIAYFSQTKLPTMQFPEGGYSPQIVAINPQIGRRFRFEDWNREP
jgi:hypothetical protein